MLLQKALVNRLKYLKEHEDPLGATTTGGTGLILALLCMSPVTGFYRCS